MASTAGAAAKRRQRERVDNRRASFMGDSSLRTTWSEGLDGGRAPDRLSGDDLLGASQRGMSL